ncbi:hypothetical protein BDZ45DRAFT_737069 [Acephala macrosclerotiorum]|nr:hypothetical protein BDZ45DRAFT_737069 [Acephala macrosclerotiorum]
MSVDGPTTLPLYHYLPLSQTDSIRLIKLQPSQDRGAPIRCKLIYTTLSQREDDITDHYTALSLKCALRHVRDPRRVFYVWADGACINQENIEERNQQVRQMGRIYSCATHIIMFLGTDELIMDGFSKLLNLSTADKDFESVSAALNLLKSPWFYRQVSSSRSRPLSSLIGEIWIYQEPAMSRDPKVQYGHIRCSWEGLCNMIEGLEYLSTKYKVPAGQLRRLEDFSEIVLHMQRDRHSYQRTLLNNLTWRDVDRLVMFHDFTTTLAARRGSDDSDSRDMIFAHLGMMRNTDI